MGFYKIDDSTQGVPLEVRAVLALVQRFKTCEDTNQQIADKLGMTIYAVAKALKMLAEAGVVNVKFHDGRKRTLVVKNAISKNWISHFQKCENKVLKMRNRSFENAKSKFPHIIEEIIEEGGEEYSPPKTAEKSQKKETSANVKKTAGDEENHYGIFLEGWQNHWQKIKNCEYRILSGDFTSVGLSVQEEVENRLNSEKMPFTAENVEMYFDSLFFVADEWQKSNWDLPIINKQINRLYAAVNRKKTELQRLADATATLGF